MRHALILALAATLVATSSLAQTPPAPARPSSEAPKRKPDLGDAAAGTFRGEIISDSRGASSAAGTPVVVTITRTGVNRVEVATDSPVLRGGQFQLEAAMGRILARSTKSNLLIDPTQSPAKLDYSPDEVVSFHGTRE